MSGRPGTRSWYVLVMYASGLGLEGDVDRVALGQELVQPEREQGSACSRVLDSANRGAACADRPRAASSVAVCVTRQGAARPSRRWWACCGPAALSPPRSASPKVVSIHWRQRHRRRARRRLRHVAARVTPTRLQARARAGAAGRQRVVALERLADDRSGVTSEPNRRVATSATVRFWSADVPPDAIVADVPMTLKVRRLRTRRGRGGRASRRRRPAGRGRCAARRGRGTAGPAPRGRGACARRAG